jgi:predicted nucleotide-binding protein
MAKKGATGSKARTISGQESPPPRTSASGIVLPYLARHADILLLVDYLRKKPLGAGPSEVASALGAEILDARKVEAYKLTGLFDFKDRVSLSTLGVEFAQSNEKARREVVWGIMKKVRPYDGTLEWAHFQKKDQLDAEGVRLKWSTEFKEEIDTTNRQRFELAPIFFFSMCEGAGLGKFVTGRKGQPARLEIVPNALEEYVSFVASPESSNLQANGKARHEDQPVVEETSPPAQRVQFTRRIFISHGKAKGPLQGVEEMLGVMGIEPKVAIREPNLARPISEKVRTTMKECSAAVFIFTPDEALTDQDGKKIYKPSENVLHELGAAAVLYDDRVVILKEKSIQLPSNISGLAHIPFDLDNVKATFMDLYKELKGFKIL